MKNKPSVKFPISKFYKHISAFIYIGIEYLGF